MAGSPDLVAKQTEKQPEAAERPLASRARQQTVRAQAPEAEDPFLGPETISMEPAVPAPTESPADEPRQYALNTQAGSDAPLAEGRETVSYGKADQPPRDMPEDDVWQLELTPALVTEAITRSRADVEEAEEAELQGEVHRVRPRATAEVRPAVPRPRSPRPRQSEFPQEFLWPSSTAPRNLATK
jgi:hypothetical protein